MQLSLGVSGQYWRIAEGGDCVGWVEVEKFWGFVGERKFAW